MEGDAKFNLEELHSKINQSINILKKELIKEIESIKNELKGLNQRIDGVEANFDRKFDHLQEDLGRMGEKFSERGKDRLIFRGGKLVGESITGASIDWSPDELITKDF